MVGGDDALVGKLLDSEKITKSNVIKGFGKQTCTEGTKSVNEGADETISFRDLNFVNLIQEDLVLLIKFRHS